jgi:hypothetical protein
MGASCFHAEVADAAKAPSLTCINRKITAPRVEDADAPEERG